jgi:ribonuclease HI
MSSITFVIILLIHSTILKSHPFNCLSHLMLYFSLMNNQHPASPSLSKRSPITIYTDGACIGNPGPGGYGAVIISSAQRQELSGGYCLTTNNRMELSAAIVALRALKEPAEVLLYSDSRYLVDGMTRGWAEQWRANNWRRKGRGKALNSDLWGQLLNLCDRHRVTFTWVEGHSGNPENERCDKLSTQSARRKDLLHDTVYEQESKENARQGTFF